MYKFYESLSYDLLIQSNRNEKTLFAETRIHTRPFKLTESRRRAQFKTLFYHSPRTNRPLFHRQNDAKTFHFPKEKHNIEQQGFHTETGIMRATTFASHAPLWWPRLTVVKYAINTRATSNNIITDNRHVEFHWNCKTCHGSPITKRSRAKVVAGA